MKGRYGVVLAVLGLMVVFFSTEGWSADWKHFRTDKNNNEWFYDAQSISREQDIIIVQTKEVLSDNEKANFTKEFPDITNIKKICYILSRLEVNCSKNMMKQLSSFWYDSEGYDVYKVYYSHGKFKEIMPESNTAKLVEIICKNGEGSF